MIYVILNNGHILTNVIALKKISLHNLWHWNLMSCSKETLASLVWKEKLNRT